jgi:hypothetical protein
VTKPELLRLVDRMGRLWPQTRLSDAESADARTLDVWFELLGPLPLTACQRALDQLSREGREFCPPPGVIFAHAQALAVPARPQLVAWSEPTAEEREVAKARVRQMVVDLAAKKSLA